MAISVRLDDEFVNDVRIHVEASSRSILKKIEHWAKMGRIAEENPDLPYSFIHEILFAQKEVEHGRMSKLSEKNYPLF
ncbi:ParD-like family protein [Xenorhabdus bovienii]|uniref:ParD-like antitoxin of type II toxin-antitoxin system n=1 Tax=Xenorhabdus bovienii str. Intermedium TaxID=1379677 RepID=A0A077QF81_XENBV|nr:hypothetical protein [Xenorhabdus bovienii]MDE9454143.1 ParD-like family protein [Xenorhabdus bovienii]MDE9544860.1 ParD-like family protein [Xenorhabdus bovienii]MDE9552885.1 ParD-like family protein [Xenorhabdus bovienii]MDE9556447.1 ParD-like family protein [Xenorhabdus bovienii]MDE9564617.1 ParD-like family protein [Xenorhabdus bovienii]